MATRSTRSSVRSTSASSSSRGGASAQASLSSTSVPATPVATPTPSARMATRSSSLRTLVKRSSKKRAGSPSGDAASSSASSPSASLWAEPAVASERPVALVLGMANTSDEYRQSLVVRPDTTYGALRDHLRLAELSRRFRFDVITMNDKQSEEDCSGYRHYRGEFSSRSAAGLQRQFGPSGGGALRLNSVFLDYFRFPPGYIQIAYRQVCPMLAGLIELGLCREECAIVLPNFVELRDRLFAQFERHEARTLRRRKITAGKETLELESVWLHYAPLPAAHYPLYIATERVWQTTPGAIHDLSRKPRVGQTLAIAASLGGYTHKHEIAQLRAEAPFVLLHVTTDEAESRRSFRETFYANDTPPPADTSATHTPAQATAAAKKRKLK